MQILPVRLEMVLEQVRSSVQIEGSTRIIDVGSDHGYLAVRCLEESIADSVICTDIHEAPAKRSMNALAEAGFEEVSEVYTTDGLRGVPLMRGDVIVIAGMGGMLIRDILTNGMDCIRQMDEFIVQPQSNIPEFRNFLRQSGFEIVRNNILIDAEKYYFPMKIRYTGKTEPALNITPEDRYGADLIEEDRGLSDYLDAEMGSYEKILEKLISESGEHNERTEEIRELMDLNRRIRSRINKD